MRTAVTADTVVADMLQLFVCNFSVNLSTPSSSVVGQLLMALRLLPYYKSRLSVRKLAA